MSASQPSKRAETGAETGLMMADRGRRRAEPARALVVQARESFAFTRKCRRITAHAKTRPPLHGRPGGEEQDEAVRPSDRPLAALGSDAPD